jgi:hypothetical protein
MNDGWCRLAVERLSLRRNNTVTLSPGGRMGALQ